MTLSAGARALEKRMDRLGHRIDEASQQLVAQGRPATPRAVARRSGVALRDVLLRTSDKTAKAAHEPPPSPIAAARAACVLVLRALPERFVDTAPTKPAIASRVEAPPSPRRSWLLMPVAAGLVGAGITLALGLPWLAAAAAGAAASGVGAAVALAVSRVTKNQDAIDSMQRAHHNLAAQDAQLVYDHAMASWQATRDQALAAQRGAITSETLAPLASHLQQADRDTRCAVFTVLRDAIEQITTYPESTFAPDAWATVTSWRAELAEARARSLTS